MYLNIMLVYVLNIVLYVAVGDAVAEDEVVCEIETDKVITSFPCLTFVTTNNFHY